MSNLINDSFQDITTGRRLDWRENAWDSISEAKEAITGVQRVPGQFIPVKLPNGLVFPHHWVNGELVPFDGRIDQSNGVLVDGFSMNDAQTEVTLEGTKWRINDIAWALQSIWNYPIPAPDAGGLIRIDRIKLNSSPFPEYMVGDPGISAVAKPLIYGELLLADITVSLAGIEVTPAPVSYPDGEPLYGPEVPLDSQGKAGDSYTVTEGADKGKEYKKKTISGVTSWVLEFTPDAGGSSSFADLTGDPEDNTALATVLDALNDDIIAAQAAADVAQEDIDDLEISKQDALVSGTNLKTVNGNSLLGSGDLTISGGGGTVEPSGLIKSFTLDYAAVGDGVADDTTEVNAALLANKTIFDNGDFLMTSYVNKYGCDIQGEARLLEQTAYIKQQINTYADKHQRVFGEEYLSSFHKRLLANMAGGTNALKVVLSGDSTTSGSGASGSTFYLNNLLAGLTQKALIPNITYVNNGHGGQNTTTWLSTYLAADLALTPHVYILRWGINDTYSAGTVQSFIDRMDTGLATIRANSSFTHDKLAIILQSQSTTKDDTLGHQGQIFNEAANRGLRALARKYKCCFMDIYAMFQDSKNGADYLDAGDMIHPQDVFYTWIANKTFDTLFPNYFKKSPITENNTSGVLNAALPSAYPFGVSYDIVTTGNGFPINGFLVTHKTLEVSGGTAYIIKQELTPYNAAVSMYVRVGYNAGWQAWQQMQPFTTGGVTDPSSGGVTNAKAPNTYAFGISLDFGTTGNSFPINGQLVTTRQSNGTVHQRLSSYDTTVAQYVRVGWSGTWQAWKQVISVTSEVTGTTQTIAPYHAKYIANNAALVVFTLPAASVVGDTIVITGKGAGGWKIAQLASQIIHGATNSTTGTGGSIASTARYDSVTLTCIVANTEWVVQSSQGTLTIT